MTESIVPRRYLGTESAADYVGRPASTMRFWRSRGEGPPFIRTGKSISYRIEDLDTWMASHIVDPTARAS